MTRLLSCRQVLPKILPIGLAMLAGMTAQYHSAHALPLPTAPRDVPNAVSMAAVDLGHSATDRLSSEPDDPIFPLQWHHVMLDTPSAWDIADGAGITVAVVDSGVACAHADLAGQCVAGWDFVDSDATPDDDDAGGAGSGTFMAGIVAATANNGEGVAGVAPGARIMPLRVVDAAGGVDAGRMAGAIAWAADRGAEVIVVGAAVPRGSDALRGAVADALDRGVTIVAGVGAEDTNDRLFPAVYPGVIGVGVTDKTDMRVPICNYGDTVDVMAPGVDILSTTADGRYFGDDGVDFAAAVAGGVAALLKSQKSSRTPAVIGELLRVTATDLGVAGWDPYYGAGRINARRALERDPGDGSLPPIPTAPGQPTAVASATAAATAAPPNPPTAVATAPLGPTATPDGSSPTPTAPWPPTNPPAPTDPPPAQPTLPPGTASRPWNPTPVPTFPPNFPTSTPGPLTCSRPWQITLLALPDLSGSGGFICPGCDGVLSSADRFLSTLCPLEPLEIVITDGEVGIGATAQRVLWHGFVERNGNQTSEIRFVVQLCDPPPYHVTMLTTAPEHYTLCPNSPQTKLIDQKDFDRFSNSRPKEGRRGNAVWSFWSCAVYYRP